MNDKCRYCDYVSKCSRQCEYDSILCKINRSFPKIVNKSYQELEEENEDLKKQLEEANKKLYLCTPEIPQNVHGKYVSYVDLVNDVYESKKQLEDMTLCRDIASGHREEAQDREVILLNQQKEFIKYLEDEIEQNTPNVRWKHYNEDGFNDYDVENPSCIEMRPTDKIFKEILQKYKSIIGVSDEKEN